MDDLRSHINKLREDFIKGNLNESDVHHDPAMQFQLWLGQAVEARITEVQAMTLSTVSSSGRPSGRIVYLREFENNCYWFYTNYNSKKAVDLDGNGFASLTFFWKELERQVRIDGRVRRAAAEKSDAYFDQRPFESKIGAWASSQSSELASRNDLENKIEELRKTYNPENIKRPPFWGGFVLEADHYEFWQGRASRLHDRIAYKKNSEAWETVRLAP